MKPPPIKHWKAYGFLATIVFAAIAGAGSTIVATNAFYASSRVGSMSGPDVWDKVYFAGFGAMIMMAYVELIYFVGRFLLRVANRDLRDSD